MSWWSYINGIITVEPMGRTQAEKRYILETVLNHLPVVTGSERDMEIYIIQKNGDNTSCSCDEYGERTNNLIDRYGNKTRNGGWLRIQERYFLLVNGSLRDREFNQTYKEFTKWLCRLAKRVIVDDVMVRISDYEKEIVINDRCDYGSVIREMFESPSWCEESNGEPNWCEHLMWNRAKNSSYPILLEYKYFNNEENDKEAIHRINYNKRRRKQ